MINKQVEFRFKGTRDYIHGTDMFNVIMEVREPPAALTNIRFFIHDFVRTTMCQLYITESKKSLNGVEDIAVRCQMDIDGITHWIAIVQDSKDNANERRYAYDESLFVSLCSIERDGIKLNLLSPYSFIETIVGMNKYMHQQLFPELIGKWIFTRIDMPFFCDAHEKLALKIRHNMNNRLTKSDIEVDGKKVGDIFFSLVNL